MPLLTLVYLNMDNGAKTYIPSLRHWVYSISSPLYLHRWANKTCHRDKIARLSVPCPSHKKLKCKALSANADTNTDAGGSAIALPELCSGELKMKCY